MNKILLKGIDPKDILDKFASNTYIPYLTKCKIDTSNKVYYGLNINEDNTKETFMIPSDGMKIIYTSLDQNIYDNYKNDVKNVEYICLWCRNKFDNDPISIPIRYDTGKYYSVHKFCCHECAYAYLIDECKYNKFYSSSEMLFRQCYNIKDISPSKHWSFHEINGGPLKNEEFFNKRIEYIPTNNIIIPVKTIYQVQQK